MNHLGDYDVIVIGAGHAGIEAAHAAAVLGAKTAVFTMSLDAIGNMPCNPSIGGTAKGTLVREVDALGGVMGLAADATYLQSRMLNKGKGPAVHALRVQTDRRRYNEYMKHALEQTPGLAIHQAEVVALEVENGHVKGVITQLHGEYTAKCVVLATGTNLGGKIFVGDAWYASGPDGMHAANALTDSLKAAGLPLRRFKTGTPARVHRRSIDFSKLECQPGDPDSELQPFSFLTDAPMHNKVECWIAYTNPQDHSGQHPAQPAVRRYDRGRRPALLPLHRGQGGALLRQGPSPALCRALRREHRGNVSAGSIQQPAGGRAERFLPQHQGL
mgnify:CR=1 FL=1